MRKVARPVLQFAVLQRLKSSAAGKHFISVEVVPIDGEPNWKIDSIVTSANHAACNDIVRLIERDLQTEFTLERT